ncbi:LuxR family maltose regulon positive regulatory protein [Agitococcus lubricus]|uniref:LuxR family maltose regulon positive regulatory protein n=2 Tax=Agitococcus lubricus TaxID=1077255 RepID=A0A2T5J3M1_9GAMM|nr:LuxR family maltose regulon positive regulatory protein [Agitococcus lubricus]
MTMDYILTTKLLIPALPAQFIARPRLMLSEFTRLTLVCAPAGYGKTTLLTDWARRLDMPCAWLSLDASDNDAQQFIMHLLSAIQNPCPAFAQTTATTLTSTQLPSINGVIRTLLNELCRLPQHLAIFIDDLHYIDQPSIYDALAFMIDHLPSHIHVIIASRNIPLLSLSRLRAQRQLTEFYTEDLRFNRLEVAEFCNQAMQLHLSTVLIDSLSERTEGWIVGLQLAALSLINNPQPATFINSFAGDDRHITDFLMDEVLRFLPAHIQDFLLETCLVSQFNASLCDAIRQSHNSRELIDELERTNLFISRLDHKRIWYRYHHLFASLLTSRLSQLTPDRVVVIHHRASLWFKEHGLLSEAIQHGIKAGDFEFVASIMEEHSATLFSLGRFTTALAWAYQLPAQLLAKHPKLTMLCAWAGLVMDNLPEIERHVRAASQCLEPYREAPLASQERALFGQLALIRSCQYCLMGDVERAEASVMDALGSLSPKQVLYRGASVCLGFCYYAQGDLAKAQRLFTENAAIRDAKYNLMIPIFATLGLGRTLLLQGQLVKAQAVYLQALSECQILGWQDVPVCGMLYLGLGELYYEQGLWQDAARVLQLGIDMTAAGHMQYINTWGRVLFARTQHQLCLDITALSSQHDNLLQSYSGRYVVETPPLSATLAQFWRQEGRLDLWQKWQQQAQLPSPEQLAYERRAEYLVLLDAYCQQKQAQLAQPLIDALMSHPHSSQNIRSLIVIKLSSMRLALQQQDLENARHHLLYALALVQDQPFKELFHHYYDEIMRLIQHYALDVQHYPAICKIESYHAYQQTMTEIATEPRMTISSSFGDVLLSQPTIVLSKKERQVAKQLLTGATSQEIAEQLCVSLSTIKTHTKHIYAKLGVNKRLQAIELLVKLNLA